MLFVESPVFVNQIAIDKGMGDLSMDFQAIVWRPAALGEFSLVGDHPLMVQIHQSQVGIITFADKPTTVNLVQHSWIVTHQLHYERHIELLVTRRLQHQLQRVLNGWEARLACEIVARHLFLEQMWRMISADGINQPIV